MAEDKTEGANGKASDEEKPPGYYRPLDLEARPGMDICGKCREEYSDPHCSSWALRRAPLWRQKKCWEHLDNDEKETWKIEVQRYQCELAGQNLEGTDLSGLDLSEAALNSAILRGANLNQTNLTGADLKKADLRGAHLLRATLDGANLCGAKLAQADLSEAKIHDAGLEDTGLREANLSGADLSRSSLQGANLTEAKLDGAKLDNAKLDGARLADASLRGASLKHASLERIYEGWNLDLRGADLFDANLESSNIWNSDLREASLRGANLIRTDLRYADLRGTDLSLAKLDGADLREAKQTLYTVLIMFRDAFRRRDNRVRVTRWDSADGIDRARMTPATRRYVKWISRVEDHRAHNPASAFMLRWLLFYGKSYILFFIQIAVLAFIFDYAYADYACPQWLPEPVAGLLSVIDPKVGEVYKPSLEGYTSDGFVPYYYSIVTMTTLGFGDVIPLNLPGRIFVVIEVILGYIYLGVLISVFASGIVQFTKGD